jgi:3-oxoadipate enol-lactonase / 4-carboxymuconolactone decarboxylase
MPLITAGDTTIFYRLSGHDDRPVVVLSHSLGQDHGMWDGQAADLSEHFRVLRYDTRGHGASGVSEGDYSIDQLGNDVLALVDALGIDRFAFCGLSLGGMIGQWLAVHAPDRITAAVLANTSARPDAQKMEARRRTVLAGGMRSVVDEVMGRFFSPRLLAANGPAVAESRRTLLATSPTGYAGCCAAIRDMDLRKDLAGIRCPVLVVDGTLDVSLPWTGHGEILARDISGAAVVHLPAAHLSNIERPRAFSAALLRFLLPPPAEADEAGLRVRRRVLGDAHVDRAIASTTEFTRDFQALITRYAWGAIWTRPGLDVRTRRLLVLAITAAMGRWEEFRLHIRTGLPRELEWCDVEEVLLQTAVYAGVPAANTGFHHAAAESEELGRSAPQTGNE